MYLFHIHIMIKDQEQNRGVADEMTILENDVQHW